MLHILASFVLNSLPTSLTWFVLASAVLIPLKIWPRSAFPKSSPKETLLVSLTMLAFGLLDGALLIALPRLRLSYGPLATSLNGIIAIRLVSLLIVIMVSLILKLLRRNRIKTKLVLGVSPALLSLWVFNLAILAGEFYGMYIEPFNLSTTYLHLESPNFFPNRPLRIVHLTDIHVERITRREREMLATVQSLHPDLIVLTGDYLNIDYVADPITQQDAFWVLAQLSAPYGVYAVIAYGVDQPEAEEVLSRLDNIIVLREQVLRLDFPGAPLYLIGITDSNSEQAKVELHNLMSQLPQSAYSVLLYHRPDLAFTAEKELVSLYLAGHTHGGQIRLPWYGAVITFSAFGKQFEMGRYQLDQTTLYVSRGIGMEGLNLPRARFLCPPEIVAIDLGMEANP
jgi:predicted MPP superfamily phosphohydrolase